MKGDVRVSLRQPRKRITHNLERGKAKAASRQGGYTIVEVMVVLTVTAALFLSAVILISGRQSRVEFSQSVGDIKSQMDQIINQVGSGYYSDTADYNNKTCQANGGAITFVSGSTSKGSNTGCIFMGRAVAFGIGANSQQYTTYTVAGLFANNGSMLTANPLLVAKGSSPVINTTNFPDAGVTQKLRGGLQPQEMWYSTTAGGAHIPIGGVAFLSSLGDYSSGSLGSGSTQLNMFPLLPSGMAVTRTSESPLVTTPLDFINKVDASMKNLKPDTDANPAGGVNICFKSGGTNQTALLTIGSNGRALTVSTKIKDGSTCS